MTLLRALAAAVMLTAVGVAQTATEPRRIDLAGASNFRDAGGYATTDGRHVRSGLLYRSNQLAGLTDGDYARLAKLGISAVCDFRGDEERAAAPTQWRGSNTPKFLDLPNPPRQASGLTDLLAKGASAANMAKAMQDTYARMVVVYAPSFRMALRHITESTDPVLFHCTAGKDRTGLFAGLLLTFLGVPRHTILEDYVLSNAAPDLERRVDAMARQLKASPEAVRVVLSVDPAWLSLAFETINREFGSLDNYRRTALALSDDDLSRLKAKLLER